MMAWHTPYTCDDNRPSTLKPAGQCQRPGCEAEAQQLRRALYLCDEHAAPPVEWRRAEWQRHE